MQRIASTDLQSVAFSLRISNPSPFNLPEPLDMQRIASTDLQSVAFSLRISNPSPFNLSSVFIIIKDSIFFRLQK
jgi:hypothetical protein